MITITNRDPDPDTSRDLENASHERLVPDFFQKVKSFSVILVTNRD